MKTNLEKWPLTVLLAMYMNLLVAEVSNVNGQFVFDEEDSAESEENNSVNPDACTTPGMPNSDNLCQTNKVTNCLIGGYTIHLRYDSSVGSSLFYCWD